MWIRNQDKTQIVQMCELYISTQKKEYCICTNRGNDLGIYSTKEKGHFKEVDENLTLK